MYHHHRLFQALQHYILLLIIDVSGHLGWASGVLCLEGRRGVSPFSGGIGG